MSGSAPSAGGSGPGGAEALGGLCGSAEDKASDLLCPVCFELIAEAYVTRCGHSFCYACVARAVELHRRCPKCGAALANREHIFPNFVLNELVAKRRGRGASLPGSGDAGGAAGGVSGEVERLVSAPGGGEWRHLGLRDVERLMDALARRRRALEADCKQAHHKLLLEFLSQLHRQRAQQLAQAAREAALVARDMQHVAAALRDMAHSGGGGGGGGVGSGGGGVSEGDELADLAGAPGGGDSRHAGGEEEGAEEQEEEESFAGGEGAAGVGVGGGSGDAGAARWRRLNAHFDDFVQCYFAHRADELYFPGSASGAPTPGPGPAGTPGPGPGPGEAGAGAGAGAASSMGTSMEADTVPLGPAEHTNAGGDQRLPDAELSVSCVSVGAGAESEGCVRSAAPPERLRGLDAFREDLVAFTRYRALRPIATLSYCSDAINYSTIVSTIEFDKDDEFFAIAGVTKRIKVYDFAAVCRGGGGGSGGAGGGDVPDVHYPCAEMQCAHKVSCVSWNAYHKNVLASSDYEGTVSVWDAHTAQRTRALQEHDKRCWSVHFNQCDVRLLASGSDDARVKLWALNAERAVGTLEARFNVCCVRFNPRSSAHLAFGCADHCVHYYDLRAPRSPLAVFRDHRKAVSYVKFADARTLLSASTDSQLKLWRVDSPRCVRSFTGHANEKNFVGLATDGKYLACGSENNALYVYYSGLSRPLLTYRFDAVRGFLDRGPPPSSSGGLGGSGAGAGALGGALAGDRREDEPSEFVSAVCWRTHPARPALLAANSQGTIKVLELV